METDLKKIVGQRLQLLRMEKNLTQEQMGEQLNLSTRPNCKKDNGGISQDYSNIHTDSSDLRELIKANSKLIEMLEKRIEMLEKHLS